MVHPFEIEFSLAGPEGDGRRPYLNDEGAFIGEGVSLLNQRAFPSGHKVWRPREEEELRTLFELGYGRPMNMAFLMPKIRGVAQALTKGDRNLAAIFLLHACLPPLPDAMADGFRKASADDPLHPGWPKDTPGGRGGKYRPVLTGQQRDYFNDLYSLIHEMEHRLNLDEDLIFGLSAYESGYLNDHNRDLKNPFGLTNAGGRNLRFSSYPEVVDYWERSYGDTVRGARDADDFIARLGHAPKGSYNSRNPKWATGVRDTIRSVGTRRQAWLEELGR